MVHVGNVRTSIGSRLREYDESSGRYHEYFRGCSATMIRVGQYH